LATANSAIYCGAEVVFADVDPATGLMTADSFEEALSRAGDRAKAVLPVHLAGAVCNMPAISKRARVADLLIVEDSCHALASSAFGGVVGDCAFSDAATFSFHPVKTMTSGEGGMITTRNSKLAERIAEKRSHGVTRDPARFENVTGADQPWWYEMQSLGWNYRMSDINAVLGRSQLARLGIFADRRRKLSKLYREALEPYSPMIKSPVIQEGVDPCRHLFNIAIDFETLKMPREQVMTALKEQGIGTQVHYIPVHRQPFYRALNSRLDLSGAERYYARSLSLPLYPDMDDDDPAHIVDKLTQILGL
jgi:dTDP-4-amino-4,6-dideoxygalactose transaminase